MKKGRASSAGQSIKVDGKQWLIMMLVNPFGIFWLIMMMVNQKSLMMVNNGYLAVDSRGNLMAFPMNGSSVSPVS